MSALKDMSAKPSSAARAGRVLGISQQGVNNAINNMRVGHGLRDKVLGYLARRGVLRDASLGSLLEIYGPMPREPWTWKRLLDLPDAYQDRQVAKRVAFKANLPVEAVARVCTRPPWTATEFAHRPTSWWADEMKRAAEDEAGRRPTPREKVPLVVLEDFEILRKTG